MSDRVFVARADDLAAGERELVEVGGVEVGVINYEGDYYAIQNVCAHDGGPVCKGLVQGKVEAEWPGPGDRVEEYLSEAPVIACPWHGWEYDLESGEHVGDPSVRLRSYDVVVDGDEIYVEP